MILFRTFPFLIVFIWGFLGVGNSYSQTGNDTLPYDFQSPQQWQNPLYSSNGGFFLSYPSILSPEIEYNSESGNYTVNHSKSKFRISNPTYFTFSEIGRASCRERV